MNKHNILNKIIIFALLFSIVISCFSVTVNAGYEGQGEVQGGVSGDISISLEWSEEVKNLLTGHEGCIEISYREAGFDIF